MLKRILEAVCFGVVGALLTAKVLDTYAPKPPTLVFPAPIVLTDECFRNVWCWRDESVYSGGPRWRCVETTLLKNGTSDG